MADESGPPKGQLVSDRTQPLIVVARDESTLCHYYLTRHFAEFRRVQVFLDRRRVERRQRSQPHHPDRRRVERRWPLTRETDLRSRPFILVLPEPGTLPN
jgi:hypothetical protein